MSHLLAMGVEMVGDGVSKGYKQGSDLGFQRTSRTLAKQCVFLTIVVVDIISHPPKVSTTISSLANSQLGRPDYVYTLARLLPPKEEMCFLLTPCNTVPCRVSADLLGRSAGVRHQGMNLPEV